MFDRVRAWFDERRRRHRVRTEERERRRIAIERAVDTFHRTRQVASMGAFVLRSDANEVIVRVMYLTNHIPPDRAWFAVPTNGNPCRELLYDDVASMEGPWR